MKQTKTVKEKGKDGGNAKRIYDYYEGNSLFILLLMISKEI